VGFDGEDVGESRQQIKKNKIPMCPNERLEVEH